MTSIPTRAQMQHELRGKRKLRKRRAGGSGDEFPLRIAKVTMVDPKRMVVDLYALTGNGDPYSEVPLTFANAGARHFLGAIPEVNDLCVMGYSPAESGFTRQPYIVAWLVPGVESGYDWMMTSPTSSEEVNLTPKMRETLSGVIGRRRHKLRQIEEGNILASSSQGSDLILNESVTLSNRRGNEIILRDQDQALVTRSLQKFHAGAGVRTYSGMVQRDGAALPSQMFSDSNTKWAADRQIDDDGKPLSPTALERGAQGLSPVLTPADVFSEPIQMGGASPTDFLARGLYIDASGSMYSSGTSPSATYGGKPLLRVSTTPGVNGVVDPASPVLSEWRVEVSHTSDGRLPVTEQTDGVDIDRLLPNPPTSSVNGGTDVNVLNRSPNEAMVSMCLGTAVGNDPQNDRASYGIPLVAQLYDKSGSLSPSIRAAGVNEAATEHAAFLLRVKNPYDFSQPEAFMAITKGGAFRSYFPGSGSPSIEEFFQAGKRVLLGKDSTGTSQSLKADGAVSLVNTGGGRSSDNVGLELRSEKGAVKVFAGGTATTTSGGGGAEPGTQAAAADGMALSLESATGMLLSAVGLAKLSGKEVQVSETDTITLTANNVINLNSIDTTSINTKKFGLTANGQSNYCFGGPLDSKDSNGPLRSTNFTGTALTGAMGGSVDETEYLYGGYATTLKMGRAGTTINVGSFNVSTMSPDLPDFSPGSGVDISAGPPKAASELSLGVKSGASLEAAFGPVKLTASTGSLTLTGTVGVTVKSRGFITLNGDFVKVSVRGGGGGGVLTSGSRNPLTGKKFLLSGTKGVVAFRVT